MAQAGEEQMSERLGYDCATDCEVVRESPQAILVRIGWPKKMTIWVPKSVLMPDSDVRSWRGLGDCRPGGKGMLIVEVWWAKKVGLHPNEPNYVGRPTGQQEMF
jgi:hypothetical protein